MESVGSNSPASVPYDPTQPIADRLVRALSDRLALLHRSDPHFYVLGATGNVYVVTLAPTPACTCPDRTVPCKHILFVLLRVLGLPFDDPCLYRCTLRPCHLSRILVMPTAADSVAGARAVERFHQVFGGNGNENVFAGAVGGGGGAERGRGGTCPVCLEEMVVEGGEEELATCSTCGNSVHGECLKRWKRSRGRRAASCVVCRARWRERGEVERYVNLSGYVGEEGEDRGWEMCAR